MRVLLDTNIVLRRTNPNSPEYTSVTKALATLVAQGHSCCTCAQGIAGLWAVLTRPVAANGLGLEPREARARIDLVLASLDFVADPADLFDKWLALCTAHEVRGRQVFDARLVALMISSGITRFVTLNRADFSRYPMIELVVPS